jgi:hypothetical protein
MPLLLEPLDELEALLLDELEVLLLEALLLLDDELDALLLDVPLPDELLALLDVLPPAPPVPVAALVVPPPAPPVPPLLTVLPLAVTVVVLDSPPPLVVPEVVSLLQATRARGAKAMRNNGRIRTERKGLLLGGRMTATG